MAAAQPLNHQAQKSLNSKRRILNAVVSIINEEGFAAASSKRICERSGLTWGAVQHHFGSKEDIFSAVLEVSHSDFSALMQAPELRSGSVSERGTLFVDLMWQHYQRDLFLAALEILMATRRNYNSDIGQLQAAEHLVILRDIFPESPLDDEALLSALVFLHNLLTGMIIDRLFEGSRHREESYIAKARQSLLDSLVSK